MLTKKIQLFASIDSLRFSDGRREFSFETKLFINPNGLIAGVGKRPSGNSRCEEVAIFDGSVNVIGRLTAAIHFGLQKFKGRLRILPSHLHIVVSQDLVELFGGCEVAVFDSAGGDACASSVKVSRR